MPGTVGLLITSARRAKRPRWSQQFLAEELERLGFPATRNQIARLELSVPTRHPDELLAAAATALEIDVDAVARAVSVDYRTLHEQVRERIGPQRPETAHRRTVAVSR